MTGVLGPGVLGGAGGNIGPDLEVENLIVTDSAQIENLTAVNADVRQLLIRFGMALPANGIASGFSLSGGNNNDYNLGGNIDDAYVVNIGPQAGATLTGIRAPIVSRDQMLIFFSSTGETWDIANDSVESLEVNRILTGIEDTLTVFAAAFLYDSASERWRVINSF